jgi:hypothetical protein
VTHAETASTAVRAFLTADFGVYEQLHRELGQEDRGAFAVILAAAFKDATVGRFGENPSAEDVIGFVAEARAQYPHVAETVTADDGEKAIRAVLGEDSLLDTMDTRAYSAAQAAMLFAITHETEEARAGIHALVTSATEQAEDYLRRRERRSLWCQTSRYLPCALRSRAT